MTVRWSTDEVIDPSLWVILLIHSKEKKYRFWQAGVFVLQIGTYKVVISYAYYLIAT